MKKFLLLSLLPLFLFAKDGKTIYAETCASCHGENGKAETGVRLVVKPRSLHKSILTKKQMFQIIKHGAHDFGARSDIMPSFKYVYNDKEIESVANYISNSFNSNIKEKLKNLLPTQNISVEKQKKMLSIGKNIFQKRCAKCHGIRGDGESEYVEMSKANSKFIYPYNLQKILLTQNQIFLFSKYGSKYWGANKNNMPAWLVKYNDYELKSVAKYIEEKIKN